MSDLKPKVVHFTDVPAQTFGDAAPGTSVRWLIDDERDGAPVYALRMIEIAPGGNSPEHNHPYEHENFVVEGTGRLFMIDKWYELKPGDVVFVPANIQHQYVNAGETTFKFLCGIPVKKFRETS